MKLWKYKTIKAKGYLSDKELDEWGQLGWELVDFHPQGLRTIVYIFKRTFDS